MKKWISVTLFLLLLLALPLTASAANSYVVDNAGLLTSTEITELEERSARFYADTGMELVILTVNSLDGNTAIAYADDYFDANYGKNGILLLIAMNEQEWHISTAGTAIEAFNDTDLMCMEDEIMKYLPDGKYFKTFECFLSDAEYYWNNEEVTDFEASLVIGIPVGFIIALIVILIMRSSMNTKREQHSAGDYQVPGSFNLRKHQDLFLYSNITKTEKPKDTDSGSSGSSVHTSSSGNSHGGRGGKF